MLKPRIVDVKKPEVVKKPKVVDTIETKPNREEEEDYSLILQAPEVGDASQQLRRQQLRDILPNQPKPGEPIQALSDDVRQKIEEDRKKRRGLSGGVKDFLGLK